MTALANIRGKDLEIFVHEIIRKDGESVAVVNKGSVRTVATFLVSVNATNILVV